MTTEQELKVALCGYLPWGCKTALMGMLEDVYEENSQPITYDIATVYEKHVGIFDCNKDYSKWDMDEVFPILYPLSSLTQQIVVKGYNGGEPFVPVEEMMCLFISIYDAGEGYFHPDIFEIESKEKGKCYAFYDDIKFELSIRYSDTRGVLCDLMSPQMLRYDYSFFATDLLNKWKIDYRNLIGKGLAIDVITLETNPYSV